MEQFDLSIYIILSYVVMEFKIFTLRISFFKKYSIFPTIIFHFLAIYTANFSGPTSSSAA